MFISWFISSFSSMLKEKPKSVVCTTIFPKCDAVEKRFTIISAECCARPFSERVRYETWDDHFSGRWIEFNDKIASAWTLKYSFKVGFPYGCLFIWTTTYWQPNKGCCYSKPPSGLNLLKRTVYFLYVQPFNSQEFNYLWKLLKENHILTARVHECFSCLLL